MSIDVPMPPSPIKTDFDVSVDDIPLYTLKTGPNSAMIVIVKNEPSRDSLIIIVKETGMKWEDALWTGVYLCRELGIPGVKKEYIYIHDKEFRLGGLYRMAGFPFTERESDYRRFGETDLGDYRSEHYDDEILSAIPDGNGNYNEYDVTDYV